LLKPKQDGTGCYYGQYQVEGSTIIRAEVLPPHSRPRPCFVSENSAMHDAGLMIYADCIEIARGARCEDIKDLNIGKLLLSAR
jgi:hypothetical protein